MLKWTEKGECFGWGQNNLNQVGILNSTNVGKPVPVQELSGKVVTSIYARDNLSAAITGGHIVELIWAEQGHVWTWGANEVGQCGQGTTSTGAGPALVTGLSHLNCVRLRFGADFVVASTDVGHCYTWGTNRYGQVAVSPLAPKYLVGRWFNYQFNLSTLCTSAAWYVHN